MNTVKTVFSTVLSCLLIMLVACHSQVEVPTQTPVIIPTLLPTLSPMPSTTATNDLMKKAHLQEICPSLTSDKSLGYELQGEIVLLKGRHPELGIGDSYLLNLESKEMKNINQAYEFVFTPAVSKDHLTLAYGVDTRGQYNIVLINGNGNVLKTIPRKEFFGIRGWLNDHVLFLGSSVLDLNTGEEKNYNPEEFPDYSPKDTHQIGWFSLNPMLNRIIYPGFGGMVMVDLETNKTLATIMDQGGTPQIAWSPDGSRVAIVAITPQDNATNPDSSEIYIATFTGQVKQATYLSSYYGYSNFYNPTWSPDGRYIAFWTPDTTGLRLLVLDTSTENVTSYCTWGYLPFGYPDPVWSPDSKQLLIESLDSENVFHTLIIDLSRNIAFQVADNAIPVGWMVVP